jgi:predicted amino acid racemase
MSTPRIEIDLGKIAHNVSRLRELYGSKGIGITAVTKVVCGNPDIAEVLVKSGIDILADSRMANIKKMRDAGIEAQFLLLRTPFLSQAEAVVKYADLSLNSDLSVIKELSRFALIQRIRHRVILMVELGDLREGLMPSEVNNAVEYILELDGIELAGIGANLACFGGIKPDDEKMGHLSLIAAGLEEKFNLTLSLVSGGNSANYQWFMSTQEVGMINNLRLGESIFLGCETLHRKPIPGLFIDTVTLFAEVIESTIKPSLPYGEVCQDVSGQVPEFQDLGRIRRAILGIGLQDVLVSGLTPRAGIDILGASSDHIILNTRDMVYIAGDEVAFDLNYGALLSAMTSPYVETMVI